MTKEDIQKGNIVYYTRILPRVGICDLFGYNSLNKTIFTDRKEALLVIHNAENNAPKVSDEKEYEEY